MLARTRVRQWSAAHMEVDGSIDVHRVNTRIRDQVVEMGISLLHAILISHFIQAFLRTLADGIHLGKRMLLVRWG